MPGTVAAVVTAVGVDAATAGTIAAVVTPALEGAALGGVVGDITGGGKGLTKGLEFGGLSGLGIGAGGALGGAVGGATGSTIGDVLGGAAGGALGGAATGQNIGTSALEGGIGGAATAAFSGTPSTAGAAQPGGGVSSAGASAAPASVGAVSPDAASTLTNSADLATAQTGNAGYAASSPGTNLSTVGSSVANTGNVGAGTTGTPSIGTSLPGPTGGSGGANFAPTISSGSVAPTGGGVSGGDFTVPAGTNTSAFATPQSFLGKVGSEISGLAGKANPAGLAISGLGLGLDAIKGQQTLKGENQLKDIAAKEMTQGSLLQNYLQTGTLPPGLQAGLDQAKQAAAATIRSRYAAQGMSGSSSEQTDLANLESTVQAQGANMALNLLQTGISETGMAAGLYEQILNNTLSRDSQLGSAITSFSTAAAGGTPGGGSYKLTPTTGG